MEYESANKFMRLIAAFSTAISLFDLCWFLPTEKALRINNLHQTTHRDEWGSSGGLPSPSPRISVG